MSPALVNRQAMMSQGTAIEEYGFDLDARFEFGLQRLLDGLAALFETSTDPPPETRR